MILADALVATLRDWGLEYLFGVSGANIEHLHPLSKGGKRTEDNEVACHKSLNDTFGNMPLKQKFKFVLEAAGSFRCPKK